MTIEITRAFVRLRDWLWTNKELARKLDRVERQASHDQAIAAIVDAISQ